MAGELAAEWIKIPDGNGNLQKVWVRDSTARRDIAQLQTDVSGKADAATTLAGYGITDAYTKTQVDGMIPSVPSAYTSNPSMDGTASPGSSTAWAKGDHVHPHDSTKADASAIPTPSSAAPAMDGTAAAGSSTDYARADHVHPSDTNKQDALTTAQLAAVDSGITTEKVASYEQNTALTLTRAENSYVNATNFARLECRKIGPHLAILHLNLRLNAALSGTSFVTIGNITGISLPYQHFTTVQSDDASGMLAVQVNETGAIRLFSSNAPASKWYRTELPLILN